MSFITKVLLLASLATTFTRSETLPTFQHIIVIIQENRSPDNLFGSNTTFVPGVDLANAPGAVQWCLGACFNPDHSHGGWEGMWNHGNGWNNGQGVCGNSFGNDCGNGSSPTITYCNDEIVKNVPSCPQETYVSGGYDTSVVQPYFDIATKYGFANYFFQTSEGPSMPAHQFLFTGTSSPSGVVNQGYWNYYQAENPGNTDNTGCTAPAGQTVKLVGKSGVEDGTTTFPCFNHNSLPTLLDNALPQRVSWRYYGSSQPGSSSPSGIWTAPNAILDICFPPDQTGTVCTGSDWVNDVVFGTSQILHDLGAVSHSECALQQVSWVVPNGDRSDHPGFQGTQNDSHQIEGGPSWVADIINTLGNDPGNCGYWNNTAVFVVWDDWGGWWDHINPAAAGGPGVKFNNPPTQTCDPTTTFGCGYTYGFRVPLLVVSAYTGTFKNGTYSGYVSGACGGSGCPNMTFPYVHDFGSILAFIENNFLGASQIGKINPQYKFADAFAPDGAGGNIPLADFFPLPQNQPRPFQAITLPPGAPNATDFINYNGPILDPDNDATDND